MLKNTVVRIANVVGETGCFRLFSPQTVPVFMVHRVYSGKATAAAGIPLETLRSHLNYLARHRYKVLTMDELLGMLEEGGRIHSKAVVFTIDDGFADHFELAARVFDEFGFALNCFVITGFLDSKLWPWDDQITHAVNQSTLQQADLRLPSGARFSLDMGRDGATKAVRRLRDTLKSGPQENLYQWIQSELFPNLKVEYPARVPPELAPMSWDNARSLRQSGHGVFPHTRSHRILSTLSPDEKRSEIDESRRRVEEELGAPARVFAYPTGREIDYDQQDVEQLKECGFKMAFTTVPDYVQKGQNLLELPRFSVPASSADFRQIVNRFEALKSRLRA